jgi:hypothetical protein
MISNGVNPWATGVLQDSSTDAALQAAQRAGVTVYAIYHPGSDYLASDYSKLYSGQMQLAHVVDETGGEVYFLGFGPLPSLAPFLTDLAEHLANRYSLEFLAKPVEGPGARTSPDQTRLSGDSPFRQRQPVLASHPGRPLEQSELESLRKVSDEPERSDVRPARLGALERESVSPPEPVRTPDR